MARSGAGREEDAASLDMASAAWRCQTSEVENQRASKVGVVAFLTFTLNNRQNGQTWCKFCLLCTPRERQATAAANSPFLSKRAAVSEIALTP